MGGAGLARVAAANLATVSITKYLEAVGQYRSG